MEKPVLIAATSLDARTYAPVRDLLEAQGFPVIVYRTDKVLSGEERLLIDAHEGEVVMRYDGRSIAPADIGAAWYRKVAAVSLPTAVNDQGKLMHLNYEIRSMHDTVWSLYPDDLWLNSPDRMRRAERKLGQLLLAHELGFVTPRTLIGSDWDEISKVLFVDNPRMVVKMIRGVISEQEKLRALYTTVLDEQKLATIRDRTTPFPGLYQPYVNKAREWRVTVVGDEVFAAAIYTDAEAKDDWRKLQTTPAVRFVAERLPDGVAERCVQFVCRSGLGFGAIDLIEDANGAIIFLECNPNGQYGWLEEELGLLISPAIAARLAKIARSRRS